MFGPTYNRVMARLHDIRQYDGTQAVNNTYVQYAKRVVVVRYTVHASRLFSASGPDFIINSKRKSVRRLRRSGRDGGRAAAHVVTEKKSLDLPDKCMSEIQAKLKSLDSHAMYSLEIPAPNFTSVSCCGANLACATRKSHDP